MARVAVGAALVLSCLTVTALADGMPVAPRSTRDGQTEHRPMKRVEHPRSARRDGGPKRITADGLIDRSYTPSRRGADDQTRLEGGQDSWSLSPKWNAANGGSSAAYGTRALINELGTTPAETTGYGAGAEVNFHF